MQRERQLTITSSRLDNLRAASYLKAAQLSRLGWHDNKTHRVSFTRVVSSTKPTSSIVIEVSATLVASTTCAQHQYCYQGLSITTVTKVSASMLLQGLRNNSSTLRTPVGGLRNTLRCSSGGKPPCNGSSHSSAPANRW